MFMAHNKCPHVKVAHNTKKVGQAWFTCIVKLLILNKQWWLFHIVLTRLKVKLERLTRSFPF